MFSIFLGIFKLIPDTLKNSENKLSLHLFKFFHSHHHPNTHAKTKGATIVASLSIMYFGV